MIHQFISVAAPSAMLLKTDSGRLSHFTLAGVNAIKLDIQIHSNAHTFKHTDTRAQTHTTEI